MEDRVVSVWVWYICATCVVMVYGYGGVILNCNMIVHRQLYACMCVYMFMHLFVDFYSFVVKWICTVFYDAKFDWNMQFFIKMNLITLYIERTVDTMFLIWHVRFFFFSWYIVQSLSTSVVTSTTLRLIGQSLNQPIYSKFFWLMNSLMLSIKFGHIHFIPST